MDLVVKSSTRGYSQCPNLVGFFSLCVPRDGNTPPALTIGDIDVGGTQVAIPLTVIELEGDAVTLTAELLRGGGAAPIVLDLHQVEGVRAHALSVRGEANTVPPAGVSSLRTPA